MMETLYERVINFEIRQFFEVVYLQCILQDYPILYLMCVLLTNQGLLLSAIHKGPWPLWLFRFLECGNAVLTHGFPVVGKGSVVNGGHGRKEGLQRPERMRGRDRIMNKR